MLTFAADAAGRYAHIDDAPASRGPFTCIVCGVALVAKRGEVNAHHFAHDPGADCTAAGGEGALHLSAKLGLQRVLAQVAAEAGTLLVNVECSCPREYSVTLVALAPADRVEVEVRRDLMRPDLVVSRPDADVLVVEIVDTHACPPEKWEALRAASAPVLEVAADALVSDDGAFVWNPATPLPHAGRALHLPPAPPCDECLRREKEQRDAQERAIAEGREWELRQEQERRRPHTRVLSACVCYQYFASGKRRKHRLVILLDFRDGKPVCARMEFSNGICLAKWDQMMSNRPDALRDACTTRFREWKRRQHDANTVALEPHWRSGFVATMDTAERAFAVHDPPQDLWWNAARGAWVRAYTMMHLKGVFPLVKKHTLFNWRRDRFKLTPLRAFDGAQETLVMDADEVDRFAVWLRKKNQSFD